MPTRKKKDSLAEVHLRKVSSVAEKGQEWFQKLFDQMQQLPQGTLVLINIETGEYITTPPAWDDVERIDAQLQINDRAGYWIFRISEGTDGNKEAGGVYSVGSIQAVA